MKILIVTQYIYPEPFKSSELAFELANRGHKVDVLTGIPNYPEGHYYKGYGLFSKRKECKNGVTFYRCFQTPRRLFPGAMGLMLNYFTFMVNATLWVLFYFAWKKKYDAIITHEPSPITQIVPACILGDFRHIPVYSWIQDIWPDALVSAGGRIGNILSPALGMITDWVYRHSTKLLITSKGMAPLINRNADYSDKIIYYPQWSEDMMCRVEDIPNGFPNVRNDAAYNIMMAGSLNSGIGVQGVLGLCEEMKDDPVHFIFVGGGSEETYMREVVKDKDLKNVTFTGRKPFSEMPFYTQQADAMLLTLKETPMKHLDIVIPARLQSYMSGGKPVLAMIGSGATEIINDADCGDVVPAGDFKALAEIIRAKVLTNKEDFAKKGVNGRLYFEKFFTKEKCIDNLCEIIENREN
jgi:glycosyltransferase involved in cell wall biosynthesis